MGSLKTLFCFLLVAFVAADDFGPVVATAFLRESATTLNLIIGQVAFYQKTEFDDVTVSVFAFGNKDWFLRNSEYGVHIHEFGDITARDATLIGDIYIGEGYDTHSCPPDVFRREGDLGNFKTNSNHQLIGTKTVNLLQTYSVPGSIIGRTIKIMAFDDKCVDGIVHGPTAAFGVIGRGLNAPPEVGIFEVPDLLTVHLFGSRECFQCYGDGWLWKDAVSGEMRFRAKVIVPNTLTQVHGFVLHESGDISTKTGLLMGGPFTNNNSAEDPPPYAGDIGNTQFALPINIDFIQVWIDTPITSFTIVEAAARGVAVYEGFHRPENNTCKDPLRKKLSFGIFGLPSPGSSVPNVPRSAVLQTLEQSEIDDCSAAGFLAVSFSSLLGLLAYLLVVAF